MRSLLLGLLLAATAAAQSFTDEIHVTPRVAPSAAMAAAAPATDKTLRIGMSRDEVQLALGEPANYYSTILGRHTTLAGGLAAAEVGGGEVLAVYPRHYGAAEFEMRIDWAADTRTSRLHPTLRIERVQFVADRPVAIARTLDQIEEARELCKAGCKMVGILDLGRPELVLYVDDPGPRIADLAALAANAWRREVRSEMPWTLAFRATWPSLPQLRGTQFAWLDEPVEIVTFGPYSPAREGVVRDTKLSPSNRVFDLGYWMPDKSGSWGVRKPR